MNKDRRLTRDFYARDTEQVARELLGMHLLHRTDSGIRRGRIVEVEAYVGAHDLACHASRGITKRTTVMYGAPGHAYVYLVYGMHHCMNVVTEPAGHGAAVLLRALEPVTDLPGSSRGPGLLCRAMGLDLRHNGWDLLEPDLTIVEPEQREHVDIVERPRVGVDYAGEWAGAPLRFYIAGSRYISRK